MCFRRGSCGNIGTRAGADRTCPADPSERGAFREIFSMLFHNRSTAASLRRGAAPLALALGLLASPAFAQTATPQTEDSQAAAPEAEGQEDTIVVTGSLFRRTDTETPSPVTVLTVRFAWPRPVSPPSPTRSVRSRPTAPARSASASRAASRPAVRQCRCAASASRRRWCWSTACARPTSRSTTTATTPMST